MPPLSPFRRAAAVAVGKALDIDADLLAVTTPPDAALGDIAVGVFPAAKLRKAAPPKLAAEVVAAFVPDELLESATAAGPYVNFKLRRSALFAALVRDTAADRPIAAAPGEGHTICIDYSSPNIAKHLAYHHIRSTVIGQALANIHRALGYRVVGINFLGDWGTTHGMLMAAYTRWGAGDEPLTISKLNDLYVKFRAEAKEDPDLDAEGRAWFKRLEAGDTTARAMWERFRDVSWREFQEVYDLLGVKFDEVRGESAYENSMEPVIQMLEAKGLTSISDGALVVDLSELNMPPLLLRKGDGATLYATRDLAAALYRWETFHPTRSLYVVDKGQGLHFKQLYATLEKAGFDWSKRCEHVAFGLVRLGGKKTGTRSGNVVLLREVLAEAQSRTAVLMQEIGAELSPEEREEVSRQVGIGAVVFANLSSQREKDVDFDWDEVLDLRGDAGPYIQYSHARIASILRRPEAPTEPATEADLARLTTDEEWALARMLTDYGDEVARASVVNEPHIVARYLLDVCAAFSKWYTLGNQDPSLKVLTADASVTRARVALASATRAVLGHGLALLGIQAPARM